jgi:hypothetical protein
MEAFDMELTKRMIEEYLKSSKKSKSEMITQYCDLTHVRRATAVKRFERCKNGNVKSKVGTFKKRGPKKKYEQIHEWIIQRCWELSGCVCAEKVHPMLRIYIEELKKNGKVSLYELSKAEEVCQISLGTLKRIIGKFPKASSRRKEKGNAFIYQKVAIEANFGRYASKGVGYVEVDFVEHNGGTSAGPFAVTAIYVDTYSQWISRAAGLGKNQMSVRNMNRIAHAKIPFNVVRYHPDNDKTILKILFEGLMGNGRVSLTRSRPYEKNDNAHVEQKGGDKVRKLVGYFRYETEEEVSLLNEIYKRADLLDNFFIANFKLKARIKNENGKTVKKVYEKPEAPYQRLLESEQLEEEQKEKLREIYKSLNMVKLREEIEGLTKELYHMQERNSNGNFSDGNMIQPTLYFDDI